MEEAVVDKKYTLFDFSIMNFLADYGWHLVILTFILAYIYSKMQPTIDEYFKKKADQEYAALYHKDPDMVASRLAAQLSAVEKLQEDYNKKALEHQRKMEEKEARKKAEWLAQNPLIGERLGSASKSQKDTLKPEYNPLMGNTSHSYRPQRKSPCSGGGCGKK